MVELQTVAGKTAKAAVAQSVERHIGNVEVTSSILVSSSFLLKEIAKAVSFLRVSNEPCADKMTEGIGSEAHLRPKKGGEQKR